MADEQQITESISNVSAGDATDGVGSLLRRTRLSVGKDIAFVSKELRIRQIYLLAIEEQRYRDLPGRAYAQGFVRGYAEYLGLDGDEIVRRFKQESGGFDARPDLVFPTAVSESSIPGGWLLILALVVAVLAYGAWYIYQSRIPSVAEGVPPLPERLAALIHQPVASSGSEVVSTPRQEPAKTSEPAAAQPAPTPAPAPLPVASSSVSAPPPAPPQASHEDVVPPAEDEQNNAASAAPPVPTPEPPAAAKPAEVKLSAKALREAKKAEAMAKQATQQGQDKPADSGSQTVAPAVPVAPVAVTEKMATVETVRTDAAKPPAEQKPVVQDAGVASSSRIRLNAEEDCWIEIRDSTTGQVVHSRLLRKGESYYVPNRSGLMLTAGNAGAMTVMVDGKSLPPLGRLGMVRRDISLDADRLNGSSGD